jgi:hypothetical protein
VVAFGGRNRATRWMTVVGVGSFVFGDSAESVVAHPQPGVDDSLVEDAYRRTVLPLALQASGSEVLHASAVLTPPGVIALCAVSGTGKSTLAYALDVRGYPLWADDAVQFKVGSEQVDALPVPFTLRLKGEAATKFGALPAGVQHSDAAPLAGVFVLERGSGATVTRLSSGDAFAAVLTHAYCFDLNDAERKRAMTDAYLRLCALVPVFHATLPDGLERLDESVDAILSTVA